MSDAEIADVVHISRKTHEKFQRLGADEEFRQMVLQEGFSIHLTFGEGVAVYYWTDADHFSARGATLSAALHQFLVEHRSIPVSQHLRKVIIKRFQSECKHDGEVYHESHGAIKKCGICHQTLDIP